MFDLELYRYYTGVFLQKMFTTDQYEKNELAISAFWLWHLHVNNHVIITGIYIDTIKSCWNEKVVLKSSFVISYYYSTNRLMFMNMDLGILFAEHFRLKQTVFLESFDWNIKQLYEP